MDRKVDIDCGKTFPDAIIPGLAPYGLEVVPGWRALPGVTIPTGWQPTPGEPNPYEDVQWRADHRAWTRRLVHEVRPLIHRLGNENPDFAAIEREKCRRDKNYFGAAYGWIYEPKPMTGESRHKPYAKFAYQCDNTDLMADWVARDWTDQARLWRSKSRQLGISWDDQHYDTAFYLFDDGAAKLTSRSEDWVDKGNSTEAMFGKVKYILRLIAEHTPYLLPEGFTIEKLLGPPNYKHMQLINPVSGTALYGESANRRVGRGGTYTYGRADEDAFIADLDDTLAAMESCPRVFLASTESFENGEEHFSGWQSAKTERPETVREYNWHQNAYLDTEWERRTLASATDAGKLQRVMREYFRDPFAGFGQYAYPEARDLPDANLPYNPDVPLHITLDCAGSGDDAALLACQPTAFDGAEGFHVLWSYERTLPKPLRMAHIATGIWPERGDECFGWEPDAEERAIGEHLYDLWLAGRAVEWFADPAGDQIHSRASFLTEFRDLTFTLRQREVERLTPASIAAEERGQPYELPVARPVAPKFKLIKQHRLMGDREYALRRYLPHVTFQTGVQSAARARDCFARTAYNDLAKAAVTAPRRKHDQYLHLASCGEYYALYYRYGFVDPLDSKEVRQMRRKLGLGNGPRPVPKGLQAAQRAVPKGLAQRRTGTIPDHRPPPKGATPFRSR